MNIQKPPKVMGANDPESKSPYGVGNGPLPEWYAPDVGPSQPTKREIQEAGMLELIRLGQEYDAAPSPKKPQAAE